MLKIHTKPLMYVDKQSPWLTTNRSGHCGLLTHYFIVSLAG